MSVRPIVHHIPVCPFSQRLEILLALKGATDAVEFRLVDITKPRDPELLSKTRGTTALPVLEMPDGRVIKESLVILQYLDETIPGPVRRADPFEHAVERMLIAKEGPLVGAGYTLVMNQSREARPGLLDRLVKSFAEIDDFLTQWSPGGTFLFEDFGLCEAVFTPIFMRFWFLDYFEAFTLPPELDRVARWREACLAHPAAQQVEREEIVKLYYDYALGAGNGTLLPGRSRSSFVFEPHWRARPWPPAEKYAVKATDAELGLT
jgi:glutathione S-transferase